MRGPIKKTIIWLTIGVTVTLVILGLWENVEMLIHGGKVENHPVNGVIAIILAFSILLNIAVLTSIKKIKSTDVLVNKGEFEYMCNTHILLVRALKDVNANMMIADKILTDTIKNEQGEETNTIKFDSIEAFASYCKCFNDLNMQYIQRQFEETKKEEEKI